MKTIEVLNQIPKLNSSIILDSPKLGMSRDDILDYLKEKMINVGIEEVDAAIERARQIEDRCERLGIKRCSIRDEEYPNQLRSIKQAPVIIYYQGNIIDLNKMKSIAVIGTRKPTKDGEKIARNLSNVLSKRGYGIVNGLALGCDRYAMKGCLEAEAHYPVAVLASGLDKIYPHSNKELAEQILAENGCLISEYEPYTDIKKYMYVQRDRIQAGLCDGVIMIEAMKESGTMHTIKYAREYNRLIAYYKNAAEIFTGNKYLMEHGELGLENNDDLCTFENRLLQYAYYQMKLFD